MSYPKPGQPARLRYGKPKRPHAPYHDKVGEVVVSGKPRRVRIPGRKKPRQAPRNHGVLIDGTLVAVPAGHLFEAPSAHPPVLPAQESPPRRTVS